MPLNLHTGSDIYTALHAACPALPEPKHVRSFTLKAEAHGLTVLTVEVLVPGEAAEVTFRTFDLVEAETP